MALPGPLLSQAGGQWFVRTPGMNRRSFVQCSSIFASACLSSKDVSMFKPPFASFGRRGAATTSTLTETRPYAPDPLGSSASPVAPPPVIVEAQATPLHQSKKNSINDTYSDSFSSPKSDFDQESPVVASNSNFFPSAQLLCTSTSRLHSDAGDSAAHPPPSFSRESSFNDSVDLMDIIDGKKLSIAPPIVAAASSDAVATAHEDLDSLSFFGAKSSSRNRAQKSMLSQSSPKLPSFSNSSLGLAEPENHQDSHSSLEDRASPKPTASDRTSPKLQLHRSFSGGSGSASLNSGGGSSSIHSATLVPISSGNARQDLSLPSINRPSAPISKPVPSSSTPSRSRPLHEAGLVESDHTQEKTLANRDSFGRMSPVTASASADDHFGMNVSASQAFRDVDSNRGRIMQLEQQLRDSLAIEERLKRQLDDAKAEISMLKRNHDERLETLRSEERRQHDQISRLKVQLEESRKSEEEARARSRSAEEVGKLTEREHFSAELKRIKDNCEREKMDLKRLHQLEMDEIHARLHASEKLTRAIDTVEQTAQRVNELSRSVSNQRQVSFESVDAAMKARERAILQSEEKIIRDMQFIETERTRIEELAAHVRELTAESRRHANEDKNRSTRDSSRLDSLVASLEAERGVLSERVINEMRRLEEIRDQCCRMRESAAADVAAERKALCEDRAILLRQQQEVTQSELSGVRRLTEWESRLNNMRDELAAAKESFENERRQASSFMATVQKEREAFAREKATLEKQQVEIQALASTVSDQALQVAQMREEAAQQMSRAQQIADDGSRAMEAAARAHAEVEQQTADCLRLKKKFDSEMADIKKKHAEADAAATESKRILESNAAAQSLINKRLAECEEHSQWLLEHRNALSSVNKGVLFSNTNHVAFAARPAAPSAFPVHHMSSNGTSLSASATTFKRFSYGGGDDVLARTKEIIREQEACLNQLLRRNPLASESSHGGSLSKSTPAFVKLSSTPMDIKVAAKVLSGAAAAAGEDLSFSTDTGLEPGGPGVLSLSASMPLISQLESTFQTGRRDDMSSESGSITA